MYLLTVEIKHKLMKKKLTTERETGIDNQYSVNAGLFVPRAMLMVLNEL